MSKDLINLFNNLKLENEDENDEIEDDSLSIIYNEYYIKIPDKYKNLVNAIFEIINEDPTFTAEISDNIIIFDNILYALNPRYKDGEIPYVSLLKLPEFNKIKIPQRNDPKWWEEKCSKFEDLITHLRNYSKEYGNYENYEINAKLIEKEVIDFACKIVQKEFEFKDDIKININLLNMYHIAKYLELYFYSKSNSFYFDEIQFDNDYFEEFNEKVLKVLLSKENKYYLYLGDYFYKKQINIALFKLLRGAQNMLILFGPYGYHALEKILDILNLNLNEVFEFKNEALKYFALYNLIELKLNNKNINLINSIDYVNFIFKGASLI